MKMEIRARNVEPMAIFILKDTREVQAGMQRTKALRAKRRNPTLSIPPRSLPEEKALAAGRDLAPLLDVG
jgi:hypothetical protein